MTGFYDKIPMERFDFGFDERVDHRTIWSPDGAVGYGENDGLWFYDAGQGIGVHSWLGHSGDQFPNAFERITVFLPGGEILAKATVGPQHTDATQSGPHMWARCDKPFERWSYHYDGPVCRTTVDELRRGPLAADRDDVPLLLDASARMLAPAFPQGAFYRDQSDYRATSTYRYNGGFRYEQLLIADATLRIDGRWFRISGAGMRTHRKGVRAMAASQIAAPIKKYAGHRWMHAIFPSGRAIYYMWHGGVGQPTEEPEAYVRDGGVFYRARPVNPMPMSLAGEGDRWAFDLESELGTIRIDCEVVADSFQTLLAEEFFGVQWDTRNSGALGMSQAFVRYRWGDEETINMMERSIGLETLTRPA